MRDTKFDRDHWLDQFSRWSDTTTFEGLVEECHAALGRYGAMIHHGTGFWRDAWIASQFAKQTGVDLVCLLHPKPFPDFAVSLNGVELSFEATEAIQPTRRRGDEYREDLAIESRGEKITRADPPEGWLKAEFAFKLLKAAAERKADKAYATTCGLVIYLNEADYGSDEENILKTFESATESAGRSFQSVDVLWASRCFRVWEGGRPA